MPSETEICTCEIGRYVHRVGKPQAELSALLFMRLSAHTLNIFGLLVVTNEYGRYSAPDIGLGDR